MVAKSGIAGARRRFANAAGTLIFMAGLGLAAWAWHERKTMPDDLTHPQLKYTDHLFAMLLRSQPALETEEIERSNVLLRQASLTWVAEYKRRLYGFFALEALGASVSALTLLGLILAPASHRRPADRRSPRPETSAEPRTDLRHDRQDARDCPHEPAQAHDEACEDTLGWREHTADSRCK